MNSAAKRDYHRELALSHKELIRVPQGLVNQKAQPAQGKHSLPGDTAEKNMAVNSDYTAYKAARLTACRAIDGKKSVNTATLKKDLATMRTLSNKYASIVARSETAAQPHASLDQLSLEERFARLKA